MSLRGIAGRHPVISYFALAYALSWSWEIPLALRDAHVRAGVGWPTHLPALLGPAVAAVIITALVDGRAGLGDLWSRVLRWRIGWGWWMVVVGTLALCLLGVAVPLLTGSHIPPLADFTSYTGIGAIGPVGVVAVAFVVNGLGEETGWRGFAAERLLCAHGLVPTALLVALGWAGWHLPMFWIVDGFRSMGVLAIGWLVGLVAGSIVLTFLYRAGHHSILLVAAWHTAYNFTSATKASGAVVGTATSVLVICWALWILHREARGGKDVAGRSGTAAWR